MKKVKIFNWNKPRTLYRYINSGDLFCYQIAEKLFGYGRIIAKNELGAYAIFFDSFTPQPPQNLTMQDIETLKSEKVLFGCIVDCYILFVSKLQSDWRIIAQDPDLNFDFNQITSINPGIGIGHNADYSISIPIKKEIALEKVINARWLDETPHAHYHFLDLLIAQKPDLFNKKNAPFLGFDDFICEEFYEIHGKKLEL